MAGIGIQLKGLVQDQTRIIFSNYFVAKYRFWKRWTKLTDPLFEACEDANHPLAQRLNANTQHRGAIGHPMKVFIMERMVSLALELENLNAEMGFRFAPKSTQVADQAFYDSLMLDALKGQFIKTRLGSFFDLYIKLHSDIIAARAQPNPIHAQLSL
jgi:hypothetical protein